MRPFVVGVRLQGIKPGLVPAVIDEIGQGDSKLIEGVETVDPPAQGWQVELRVALQHDDVEGAVTYAAMCARRGIRKARARVTAIAVAARG